MIYVVCQIWRQTEELCLFCVKSGSRHLILISASEEHVQCVRGVPAHAAEPPRAVCDNLLNVESTPPFFLSVSLSLSLLLSLPGSLHPRPPSPHPQADCRSREYLRIRFPAADSWVKQWGKWQNTSHTSGFSHFDVTLWCTHSHRNNLYVRYLSTWWEMSDLLSLKIGLKATASDSLRIFPKS